MTECPHHPHLRSFDVIQHRDCRYAEQIFTIDNYTITYAGATNGVAAHVWGHAVTFAGPNQVALANHGQTIIGKLLEVFADLTARVQVGGYADFPAGTDLGVYFAPVMFGTPVGALDGIGSLGCVGSLTGGNDHRHPHIVSVLDPDHIWVDLG